MAFSGMGSGLGVKEEEMEACDCPSPASMVGPPPPLSSSFAIKAEPNSFVFSPLATERGRSSSWPTVPDTGVATPPTPQKIAKHSAPGTIASPLPTSPQAAARALSPGTTAVPSPTGSTGKEKKSPRRNAWGAESYADLISKAVLSTKDKRMTLNQIYEWMVENVTYFKDKGDTNSAAGWKNSVRHNLSLHQRFIKVQNEQTGKSNWWMINPDAKRNARRRHSFGNESTASPARARRQGTGAAKGKRTGKVGKPLKSEESSSSLPSGLTGGSPAAFSPGHLSSPLLDCALAASSPPSFDSPLVQDDYDPSSPLSSAMFASPSPSSSILADAGNLFSSPPTMRDLDHGVAVGSGGHHSLYLSGSEGSNYDDGYLSQGDIMLSPEQQAIESSLMAANPSLATGTETLGGAISSMSLQPKPDAVASTYRPPFEPSLTPVAGTPFDTPLASIQGTPHHTPPPHPRYHHNLQLLHAAGADGGNSLYQDPYYEPQNRLAGPGSNNNNINLGMKLPGPMEARQPRTALQQTTNSAQQTAMGTSQRASAVAASSSFQSRQRSVSDPSRAANRLPPAFSQHCTADDMAQLSMPPPLQPIHQPGLTKPGPMQNLSYLHGDSLFTASGSRNQHHQHHHHQQQQQQQQQQHVQQQQQQLIDHMALHAPPVMFTSGSQPPPPSYGSAYHNAAPNVVTITNGAMAAMTGQYNSSANGHVMYGMPAGDVTMAMQGLSGDNLLMPYPSSIATATADDGYDNPMLDVPEDQWSDDPASELHHALTSAGMTEADMEQFIRAGIPDFKANFNYQQDQLSSVAAGAASASPTSVASQPNDAGLEFNFEHFSPPDPKSSATAQGAAAASNGSTWPSRKLVK